MDEQELAREAVRQARRDEMYRPPATGPIACPYCGLTVSDNAGCRYGRCETGQKGH